MVLVGVLVFTSSEAQAAKQKAPDPTIFVAPFSSTRDLTTSPEYQWLGDAMAMALDTRLFQTTKINYLALRQVQSTLQHEKIRRGELHIPETAANLGRAMGADYAVVGSYSASWPDVKFVVRVINVSNSNAELTFSVYGHIGDMIPLEAEIAKHLIEFKPLAKLPTKVARMGTEDIYAWREYVLAQQILMAQSLAPNREVILPEESINEAMKHLTQALTIDKSFGPAQADMAICEVLLKDYTKADQYLAEAVSNSKTDPETLLAGYFIKWQQRQDGPALAELSTILEKFPGYLLVRGYKGEMLLALKRYDEAVTHFDEYITRVPSQVWAMSQKGYALSKLGKFDEAINITAQAAQMHPESPVLAVDLASRYIDAKKFKDAEAKLKAAITKFPKFALAYSRLSFVKLSTGFYDEAKELAEQAIVLASGINQHKERAYARLNLAHIYILKGEMNAAADALQLAAQDGLQKVDQIKNDPKCQTGLTNPLLAPVISKFNN